MPAVPRCQTPDASPKRLRLGRGSRLGQNRDFTRVRQQGERLALGCLIANWHRLPDGTSPKLGVVTSKRIGNAVARSRARRLLRESFRQHQHEFSQPVELVLVARQFDCRTRFCRGGKGFSGRAEPRGLAK